MSWDYFGVFAIAALHFWGFGAFAAWHGKRPTAVYVLTLTGLAIFFSFIIAMWISLERPPMRTMGETRLWYSFFLPLAGLITYSRCAIFAICTVKNITGWSKDIDAINVLIRIQKILAGAFECLGHPEIFIGIRW